MAVTSIHMYIANLTFYICHTSKYLLRVKKSAIINTPAYLTIVAGKNDTFANIYCFILYFVWRKILFF